jgi:hypothetical protein
MLSAVVASCLCTGASFGALVETQTFDSSASAAAAGWTSFGSQGIGWSNSTNAGAPSGAGEAGGQMTRSGNEQSYRDTTVGALSMNDAISFSGAYAWTAAGAGYAPSGFSWFLAYTDSTKTSSSDPRANSYAGFSINERSSNANTVRVALEFNSAAGNSDGLAAVNSTGPDVVSNQIILDKSTKYTFTWDYNPSAGANGQVTLNFYDASRPVGQELRGTMVGDLSASQRSTGVNYNTFGITNEFWGGSGSTADNSITAFVDDLTYSSVPEPSALAMLGLGLGALARRRRS